MRILHIWACGLGEELGWLGKVGRDRLSSLGDACVNSHQIGGFGTRSGGEKQLVFNFTLPVLHSGSGEERRLGRGWRWTVFCHLSVTYCVSASKEGSGLNKPGGLEIHGL